MTSSSHVLIRKHSRTIDLRVKMGSSTSKEDLGVHNFFGIDLHGASVGVAFVMILAIAIFGLFCCFTNHACQHWVFGRGTKRRQQREAFREHYRDEAWWTPPPWHIPMATWAMQNTSPFRPTLPAASIHEIPDQSARIPGNTPV